MTHRRDLLKLALASGGRRRHRARPGRTPSPDATGTIEDVEHVVILMQENRCFDHYFGSLCAVCAALTIPTPSRCRAAPGLAPAEA